MEPMIVLGFLFAVFCGLAGLILGNNQGTYQMRARQNVRLPILTIGRVAPFL